MKPLNYETELEMATAITVLANFDDGIARDIGRKIAGRSLYITGMGSSLLFTATNAKRRAEILLPNQRIETGYTPNLNPEFFPKDSFVFLSSNSGKTVEIIELAEILRSKGIDFFGVTTIPDSPLAKICKDNLYILQGPFEKGVAATKSIIEQGLFYDAVIHAIAEREFPLAKGKEKNKKVCEYMESNFNAPLKNTLARIAILADNYFWIDHNTGLREELALKSCEIAGKRGIYESGTQILHGRGEVIKPDDLIFVTDPQSYKQKDLEELIELSVKTLCRVVSLSKEIKGAHYIPAKIEPVFEGYCILPVGWNLLREVGKAKEIGRNIDHPEIAQKARIVKE